MKSERYYWQFYGHLEDWLIDWFFFFSNLFKADVLCRERQRLDEGSQTHIWTVWPVESEDEHCWSFVWLRGAVKIKDCDCTCITFAVWLNNTLYAPGIFSKHSPRVSGGKKEKKEAISAITSAADAAAAAAITYLNHVTSTRANHWSAASQVSVEQKWLNVWVFFFFLLLWKWTEKA